MSCLTNKTLGLGALLKARPRLHSFQVPELSPFLVSVRWRKRRDQPKAPSKLYYVRQPTVRNEEEYEYLKKEYPHYRTAVKSIRSFLYSQNSSIVPQMVKVKSGQVSAANNREFWEKSYLINEEWNAKIAAVRDQRLAVEISKEHESEEEKLADTLKALEEKQNKAKGLLAKRSIKKNINMKKLDHELIDFLYSKPEEPGYAINSSGELVDTKLDKQNIRTTTSDDNTEKNSISKT